MINVSKRNILKCGVAPLVLSVASLAGSAGALAQQAAPAPGTNAPAPIDTPSAGANGGDEIVVTGTRIVNRPDLKSASPIASVTAETLSVTNSNTVESYLTQLPQFVSSIDSATNNGGSGEANVDLRGLGAGRTLVLLDGKRMVPGDITGPVDIDAIPSVMIKRVDVLTGGASTVYGADAIAGVVNFILDDTYVGATGDASTQITNYGDGMQTNVDAKVGFKLPNDGHLVIGGQYTKRDGVYESARAFAATDLDSSSLQPSGSSNAVPTVITIANCPHRCQLDSNGNFVQGVYKPYNFNPANYFVTPLSKWTVMAMFQQPITDDISMYIRGSYTHSDIVATLAPTATAGYNFTISPTNPFLNATNYNLIFSDPDNLNADGTANVAIGRRIVEDGGRVESFSTKVKYIVGGFKGSLGPKFNWEVFGQYGSNDRHLNEANDISYARTQQAIDAVTVNGVAQCADPSGGCIPLNVFSTAPISAASLSYISETGTIDNHYEQEIGGGSISGSLDALKSPFASDGAAVAAGVEYRREEGSQSVSASESSGDLLYYGESNAVPAGSFNVKEVYGEIKMPLVTDKPFFQELGFEGGIRYSAYTNHTVGGTNKNNQLTYKFGGDWTPVAGLRLRALYNKATRDPNLNELDEPVTPNGTDNIAHDPCAGTVPAAYQSICIAQGAPANLVKAGSIPDVIAGQVNELTGGNPNLKPEKATTITLGAVLAPPSLPAFHMTVDYYHIKISDYIASANAQQIVSGCFGGDSALCSFIIRDPIHGELASSATSGVEELLINVASLRTSGIDVTADYKFHLGHDSSLTLGVAGTYIINWDFLNGSADTSCSGHYGSACAFVDGGTGPQGAPMPKWKHIVSATYQNGPFSFYGAWRLLGSVTEDAVDVVANASNPYAVYRIPSYSYFDATAGFDIADKYKLRVGVKNMFNIDPPIVGGNSGSSGVNAGNTFPTVYDPLGRTFFVNLTLQY